MELLGKFTIRSSKGAKSKESFELRIFIQGRDDILHPSKEIDEHRHTLIPMSRLCIGCCVGDKNMLGSG